MLRSGALEPGTPPRSGHSASSRSVRGCTAATRAACRRRRPGRRGRWPAGGPIRAGRQRRRRRARPAGRRAVGRGAARGAGTGRAAIDPVLDHALGRLGLRRADLGALASDRRAIRCWLARGFVHEGAEREAACGTTAAFRPSRAMSAWPAELERRAVRPSGAQPRKVPIVTVRTPTARMRPRAPPPGNTRLWRRRSPRRPWIADGGPTRRLSGAGGAVGTHLHPDLRFRHASLLGRAPALRRRRLARSSETKTLRPAPSTTASIRLRGLALDREPGMGGRVAARRGRGMWAIAGGGVVDETTARHAPVAESPVRHGLAAQASRRGPRRAPIDVSAPTQLKVASGAVPGLERAFQIHPRYGTHTKSKSLLVRVPTSSTRRLPPSKDT